MLTNFGKFVRKIRIDNGDLLKDMADVLQVTSSYLSAVEIGKRNVPIAWAEIITKHYKLNKLQEAELYSAIDDSQLNIKIDLSTYDTFDKNIVLTFARKFDTLADSDKEQIRTLLSKHK